MVSESYTWPRRERRSSRDSILGFHPEGVVVFGEEVADAEREVEKTGVETRDDGSDAEENP